ncbi:MAG: hypothetical protein ABH951_01825 [Patescibacteria group bacterium]
MNKKSLLSLVKVLGLCLVFGLFIGISFANAAPVNPPAPTVPPNPATPPANNVYGPLNVGPATQNKAGSLHITAGGFRSWGPGLFDDIVIIGYGVGSAPSGGGSLTLKNVDNQKIGFFARLSKFLGLDTEVALAANPQCGNANGGTFPSITSSSFVYGGNTYNLCGSLYQTNSQNLIGSGSDANYWKWECRHMDFSNSTIGTISCSANKTTVIGAGDIGADDNIGVGDIGTGGVGGVEEGDIGITTPAGDIYRLTVNGRSNLNGYTKVEGDLDVAGSITSGGKNVCLEDGTNCVVSAFEQVVSFGGTYAINTSNEDCLFPNPLSPTGNTCACPNATYTSYTMMQFAIPTSPVAHSDPSGWLMGGVGQRTLKGCYKTNVVAGQGKQ